MINIISHQIKQSSKVKASIACLQIHFNRHLSSQAGIEKILRSPAPVLDIPKGNFVNTLFKDVHKWSNKTAFQCSVTNRETTYDQLREQSAIWSGFLKQEGVSKGDVIAIISPNCPEYAPIFIGTAAIGATLSPINWKYTPDEIRRMLEIAKPKILVYATEIEELVVESLKDIPRNIKLFCIGKSIQLKTRSVEQILNEKGIHALKPDDISGNEIIYMPFSSGTTGPPKAVALSHNAFIASVHQYTNSYHDILRETTENFQEVTMAMLPFFHIYGITIILSFGVLKGSKIVTVPKFDPQPFLNTIIQYKISCLHTVPTLLNLLNNSDECNPENMKHITSVLCGASPVHASAAALFKKKINKDIVFFEGYGMTEVLVTHHTPREIPKLGSCGQLLSNVECKVIHPQTGETLGPNQDGEICIKTPAVMTGYVNNEKATAEILQDGWIHTGDIGHYDDQEFFFIVDRTKDLIKVHGMQVSPSEIEEELQKHPCVKECSVIGIPHEKYDEVPKAFVVRGSDVTEQELVEFLEDKLSSHKQLRGGISFIDALPKSDTGKVLRKDLRTME